jgi:tRNA(Ile)-lysidine synthase
LRGRGLGWSEDPTNADARFARTRARRALAALAPLGIDAAGLAAVAERMAAARAVLAGAARAAAAEIARVEGGDVLIDAAGWRALPAETRARLLAATLRWLAGADYAPRRADLDRLMARIAAAGDGPMAATLHGCALRLRAGRLRLAREWRAVAGRVAPVGALWDGRWRLVPPEGAAVEGLHVAALGPEGLAACPRRPRGGLPRASLLAGPAVWDGPWLVAAPLAGLPEGWRAETVPPAAEFPQVMLRD